MDQFRPAYSDPEKQPEQRRRQRRCPDSNLRGPICDPVGSANVFAFQSRQFGWLVTFRGAEQIIHGREPVRKPFDRFRQFKILRHRAPLQRGQHAKCYSRTLQQFVPKRNAFPDLWRQRQQDSIFQPLLWFDRTLERQ